MAENNALIEEILRKTDIVSVISNYLPLIKRGRNYWAVCPFHDDKNPSMSISREKGLFKCFSCNTGGNAITFVQRYEKIPYGEAVKKLAQLIGFDDPRLKDLTKKREVNKNLVPLYSCINDLASYYAYSLNTEESAPGRAYLAGRNIKEDQIEKFGIGYAPNDGENTVKFLKAKGHSLIDIEGIGCSSPGIARDKNAGRIVFPLWDADGQVVGFSARRINNDEDSSKYINTQEDAIFHKGQILYNYHRVRNFAKREGYCYLLEGFMDVMALDRAGIESAVALMGTSLSEDHLRLLRRLNCEIRLCLDGDEPGQKAMMKIIAQLAKTDIPYRIVSNPGDLRDPDEILQDEGVEGLKEKLNNLLDPYSFQINYYLNTKKLDTQEERQKVLMHFIPFLRDIRPGIEREDYVNRLSKATGYQPETIYAQINKPLSPKSLEEETEYEDYYSYELFDPGDRPLSKRLYKAERTLLYYLMSNKQAMDYYRKNQGMFYTDIHRDLADYLYQYRETHDSENVDAALLIGQLESEGEQGRENYRDIISRLALSSDYPPCSEQEMNACKSAIEEESEKLYESSLLEKSIQGKDSQDKARIIGDYAKSKRNRLRRKKEERN